MTYTVKKLSEISGVTVRTLHFYEEAGLLKPAYYGANGYRYYEEKELLQLQQILFFKELALCIEKGLDLADGKVQKIIKKHHAFAEQTHSATQEVYKAMTQLYAEHPEFRKQLDPFHPELAVFMAKAMKIFADRELS